MVAKKPFRVRVAETRRRIESNPTYQKDNYIRRLTGILVLKYGCVCLALAFIADQYFNVSGYLASAIAGVTAITLAILNAEKKANKKFNGEK
jgi:hypothetical protein